MIVLLKGFDSIAQLLERRISRYEIVRCYDHARL